MADNLVEILLSIAGAEAVTGALEKVQEGTGELSGELLKLGGVAVSVESVIEGLRGALEMGDQLQNLSLRTAQSVSDLVVMQRAFDKTGLGAEQVGVMVNRLQKALSGVNDMGKSTVEAFHALGTSQNELDEKSFTEQVEILGDKFRNLKDPAQAAAIAMQIFGREGGQMLALFKDRAVLEDAAEDAGRLGDRMQHDAKVFADAGLNLQVITIRLKEMWVVAVEQLLPVLQTIGNVMKGLNFSSIGAGLGTGGAIAFAATMASTLVSKLDTAVMAWATSDNIGNSFAKNMVYPVTSKLSEFFEVALPPIIIAAVAGAIVTAIAQAMVDTDNRLEKIRSTGADEVGKLRKGITGATTREGAAQGQDEARKALKEKQEELEKLQKIAESDTEGLGGRFTDPDTAAKMDVLKQQIEQITAMVKVPINDTFIDRARVADASKEYAKLLDNVTALNIEHAKLQKEDLNPYERKASLQDSLEQRENALSQTKPAAMRDDVWNAHLLEIDTQRLQIIKEIKAADKEIDAENQKETEATKKKADLESAIAKIKNETAGLNAKNANNEDLEQEIKEKGLLIQYEKELQDLGIKDMSLAKDKVAAEHNAYVIAKAERDEARSNAAARLAMERGILELQNQETQIQGDFTKTEDEKFELERKNLQAQIALHEQYLKKLREERDLEKNPVAKAVKDQGVHAEESAVGGLQGKANTMGPDPKSYGDQMTAMFTRLRGQYTTNARAFATSMEGAITSIAGSLKSSVSGELSNIIMKTETWGEGMRNIGKSFLTSIVGAFTQMVAEYAVRKAAMFVIDEIMAAKSLLLSIASAAKSLVAWIPSAIAASISSYGIAAAVGAAAVIAIIAAKKGFSDGGYTGDGPTQAVAGEVHHGEFVFSAPAVSRIGRGNLESMHNGGSPAPMASQGRASGRGRSAKSQPMQVVLVDNNRAASKIKRNSGVDAQIVSVMKANRGVILGKG